LKTVTMWRMAQLRHGAPPSRRKALGEIAVHADLQREKLDGHDAVELAPAAPL